MDTETESFWHVAQMSNRIGCLKFVEKNFPLELSLEKSKTNYTKKTRTMFICFVGLLINENLWKYKQMKWK